MAKPIIDEPKCKGCGTCKSVCPADVFEWKEENKKMGVAKPDNCIECRACEASCPEQAIVVK